MRKLRIISVVGCLLLANGAHAHSVGMILENDCFFNRSFKNQDNDYTHGTGLEYWYGEEWRFLLQQNMYTPSDIGTTYHVPGSRPYAGWLGAEVGKQLFINPDSPWTHYAAVNFGMVGPSSQAGETQKLVHRILGCREPEGWATQLSDEFCANGQWWTKYNWYLNDYMVLIPRVGVLAGTLEDATEGGGDFKVGWNIKKHKDMGNNQMFSATGPDAYKTSFWDRVIAYAFFGGDCRYYLYNHMLQGSLFNSKDDDVVVDPIPFVGEMVFGAYLEVYGVFFKYYCVIRSREYKDQPEAPDYGGMYFGYRWEF